MLSIITLVHLAEYFLGKWSIAMYFILAFVYKVLFILVNILLMTKI